MPHPPFRAEHIGSLLRPAGLLDMRRRFARGEVDHAALTHAEDRAIEDAVRLQERLGLRLATDGEFRRRSYHSYFYGCLGDIAPDAVSEDSGAGSGRAAPARPVAPAGPVDPAGRVAPAGRLAPAGRVAQPKAVVGSKLRWARA